MNRREILEERLRILDELDGMEDEEEGDEGDASSLGDIRDFYIPRIPRGFYLGDLSHLRKAVWPYGK